MSDEEALSREKANRMAEERGLVVVEPAPNQLFLDIDSKQGWVQFLEQVDRVRSMFPGLSATEAPSPSGKPWKRHVVVELPFKLTEIERIALQAILGSDPTREAMSWLRLQRKEATPTLFFEKPERPDPTPIVF